MAIFTSGCATQNTAVLITPGASPQSVSDQLRAAGYCLDVNTGRTMSFAACEHPEFRQYRTWVVATFRDTKLVELQRHFHFADYSQAQSHWDNLIGIRRKQFGPASEAAESMLRATKREPRGMRASVVFAKEDRFYVGVYLLAEAADAHVVELTVPAVR